MRLVQLWCPDGEKIATGSNVYFAARLINYGKRSLTIIGLPVFLEPGGANPLSEFRDFASADRYAVIVAEKSGIVITSSRLQKATQCYLKNDIVVEFFVRN